MLTENETILFFLGSVATLFGSLYLVYIWALSRQKKLDSQKHS